MKTTILLICALMLLATSAFANTRQVLDQNPDRRHASEWLDREVLAVRHCPEMDGADHEALHTLLTKADDVLAHETDPEKIHAFRLRLFEAHMHTVDRKTTYTPAGLGILVVLFLGIYEAGLMLRSYFP